MKSRSFLKVTFRTFSLALLVLGVLMSFAPNALALFTNGDFESGNIAAPWVKTNFINPGLLGAAPFSGADIQRNAGGSDLTLRLGPFATMSQTDANTGDALHFPLSGNYCAVINFQGKNQNANSLAQQDVTSASDVAPDGRIHVMFTWAGVVQNPVHTDTEQPYIYIALTDVTKGTLLYETFNFAGTSAVWHNVPASNPLVQYTDWQIIDIPCDSSMVTVGDTVKIEAVAAGCSLGGHWGYLYVDRFGSFYPVTPVITANDKPFDGTTAATIATRSLTGVRPGDDVSLTGGTATFDTAAVGTGKTVTASGLSLTGADAGKYMLTSYSATTAAGIYTTPTVTTTVPSSVTAATAAGGGNVTSDGGGAVTARGVCWSTSANPTVANSHTTDGIGTGVFTSSLTGLTENTTYHVRAYATNGAGTSYGSDRTFTTTFTVSFVTDGTAGASLTGTVTQSVPSGGSSTGVTANAPVGHHFVNWTYGSSSSTNNPLTLSPINASITVTAHFAINTYALSYTHGAHGTLTGSTSQTVDYGGSGTAVTAVPDTGYHFVSWSDGLLTATRTDANVSGDLSVTASFAINTYTLSYAHGAHGTLAGSVSQTVDYGGTGTAVTAVPDTGYHFVSWSDGALTATRTDSGVSDDLDVTATFAIDTFTVNASAGNHGRISPAGAMSVDYGADQTFRIIANVHYHVADVLVDGVSVGAVTSYTFSGVTAGHTIVASFTINTCTITASAGNHGKISPSGAVSVNYNAGRNFQIIANGHYHVADVLVDGVSVGAVTSYTFTTVTTDHTIVASFTINTYTINASASANGAISPSGAVSVNCNGHRSFTIAPDAHYHVAGVLVDGVSVGAVTSYAFTTVTTDHTIVASFAIDSYALSYTHGAHGTLTGSTSQTVDYGGSGTAVTAVPDTGYHFVSWSDGLLTATRTDANVSGDLSVTASFAPTHPPTTTVKGLPSGWVHHVVTLTLVPTRSADGGPIAYTEYRIGTGPWMRGTTVIVTQQGVTTITYHSADTDGNIEAVKTCQVRIDLTPPAVRNGLEVNVRWNGTAKFTYRGRDNVSTALHYRLVIKYHGKIVLVKQLGLQPVGRRLATRLHCTMRATGADAYMWRVEAFDGAGNHAGGLWQELEVWPPGVTVPDS